MRKIAVVLVFGSLLIWSGTAWGQAAPEAACVAIGPGDLCPDPPDATGNCGCDWAEDFEGYAEGEIPQAPRCVGDVGQPDPCGDPPVYTYPPSPSNWWAGWGYVDTVLGEISTDQNHTDGGSQSMRIDEGDDQVHWFLGRGIGAGNGNFTDAPPDLGSDLKGYDDDVSIYWVHTGHVYIPGDHTDDHFYIMNSFYPRISNDPDTGGYDTTWHVQIEMNSRRGLVWDSGISANPTPEALPIIEGEWAEIRVEINFQSDVHLIYYGGDFMAGYQWAALAGGGPEYGFLGNLDLFSNQGNYAYYDDLSMIAEEPPPFNRPTFECFLKELDANRCAKFVWRLTNENTPPPEDPTDYTIARFYIDMDAGEGGRSTTCRGGITSTVAFDPIPGWTITNCTGWEFPGQKGHALFRFEANTPADNIQLGETLISTVTVDTNKSREFERADDLTNFIAGTDIPAFTVLMSAAQVFGNEAFEACTVGPAGFLFGPAQGGGQQWSGIGRCAAFLNVPALSTWTKLILAALVLAGGTLLVLRSRRVATA